MYFDAVEKNGTIVESNLDTSNGYIVYFFAKNGLLDSAHEYSARGILMTRSFYSFNTNRAIESTVKISQKQFADSKSFYKYDNLNRQIEKETKLPGNMPGFKYHIRYLNQTSRSLVYILSFYDEYSKNITQTQYSYFYNKSGNIDSLKTKGLTNKNAVEDFFSYIYDSIKNEVKTIRKRSNSENTQISEVRYDERGNKMIYQEINNAIRVDYNYIYNDRGDWVKCTEKYRNGNDETGTRKFTITLREIDYY